MRLTPLNSSLFIYAHTKNCYCGLIFKRCIWAGILHSTNRKGGVRSRAIACFIILPGRIYCPLTRHILDLVPSEGAWQGEPPWTRGSLAGGPLLDSRELGRGCPGGLQGAWQRGPFGLEGAAMAECPQKSWNCRQFPTCPFWH